MKRKIAILICLLALGATGCHGDKQSISESMVSSNESTVSIGHYDDVFREVTSHSDTAGMPMTYDEVVTMISNPDFGGLDSYYLLETVRALTLNECEELDGWFDIFGDFYGETFDSVRDGNEIVYLDDYTVYEVNVIKDLISDEDCNYQIYLLVAMGNPMYQEAGDPIYAPGERFSAALSIPESGTEIRKTTGDFALRYDVISEANGNKAYSRGNEAVDSLCLSKCENISEIRITSTTENPAVFTQSMPFDSLTGFLKQDWEDKEISKHFAEKEATRR